MTGQARRTAHACREWLDYIGGSYPWECTVCHRRFEVTDSGGSTDVRDMFSPDAVSPRGIKGRAS